jgi:hypothetical protein
LNFITICRTVKFPVESNKRLCFTLCYEPLLTALSVTQQARSVTAPYCSVRACEYPKTFIMIWVSAYLYSVRSCLHCAGTRKQRIFHTKSLETLYTCPYSTVHCRPPSAVNPAAELPQNTSVYNDTPIKRRFFDPHYCVVRCTNLLSNLRTYTFHSWASFNNFS